MTSNKGMTRLKRLLRSQFLEDFKTKITEITKDEDRGFCAFIIISDNNSILSYCVLLEILVAEAITTKACYDFYEKYGISSADINMVQVF